jgi:hypothetical protein
VLSVLTGHLCTCIDYKGVTRRNDYNLYEFKGVENITCYKDPSPYSFCYREKPLDVKSNKMIQILPFIDLLSCANPQTGVVWFDVLMPMLTTLANLRDGQIPQKII